MYFFDFDSYKKAVDTAKTFQTRVSIRESKTSYSSSPIPAVAYGEVLAAVAACHETKSAWMQWDRDDVPGRTWVNGIPKPQPSIVTIPYDQIDSIQIFFNP